MTTTTVGERIRHLRKMDERRLSQEELSRAIGCHRVHLARIETGSRNPSWRLMARIAEALEVPLETVTGGVSLARNVSE